jgi:hypothetical protein
MEADYKILEEDYVNAMKLYSKITPKIAAGIGAVIVVLVIAAIFGGAAIKGGVAGGLIGGGVVLLLSRFIVNPLLTRRNYRNYKSIHENIHIRLKDEGIEFSTVDGEGILRWDKILKWRQNESLILIYPMPRLYHIVPKSIKEAGFDLGTLVHSLESKVGHET